MNTFFYIIIFLTFTNLISLGFFLSDIEKKIDKLEKKLDYLYGLLINNPNSNFIDSKYEINENNIDAGKEFDIPEEYFNQFRKNIK